jgi:periplasmic protein TonB
VELRAVIATDGTIQSLEVISGDPLLIRSALDAVRDWRYHPTILNGQPIEVETHITVIYTLSH